MGGVVFGVSNDSLDSHRRFAEKEDLPYHLISDPDFEIIKLYKAKRVLGYRNRRVTYLIDQEGVIRGVYHHELAMVKHRDDVLEGLRALEARLRSA